MSATVIDPGKPAERNGRDDDPGPVRLGSERHKTLFSRMLLDTHNPYKPAVIDWPRLDPDARDRLVVPVARDG